VSIPAGLALVLVAPAGRARVGAAVYSAGLATLFGVSAAYHRGNWRPPVRRWMKRLDHGAIFVMIAGTYTPFCLLVLRGVARTWILVAVWAAAATGVALAAAGLAERPGVGFVFYIALGWVAIVALPEMLRRLSAFEIALLVAGGVIYTVGAVGLARRRPDPFPATFGYHEVWHTMVIAAAICHYLLVLLLVRAVRPP
jgi:hemolysin III